MRSFVIYAAIFATFSSFAAPKHFASVTDAQADFNNYPPSEGDFAVLKEKPLTVTVSPRTVAEDSPTVTARLLEKASVNVAYRSFIHTDVNQITIIAFPHEYNYQTHSSVFLKDKPLKLTITRQAALKEVQKYLHVNSFSDLVEQDGTTFTPSFYNCCYLPEGKPGLKSFYATLSKK